MGDNSRWPGLAVLRLSLLVLCVLVLGLVLLWTGVEPARRRLRLSSSGYEREEGKAPCSTLMRRLRVQGGQEDRWDSDWDRYVTGRQRAGSGLVPESVDIPFFVDLTVWCSTGYGR